MINHEFDIIRVLIASQDDEMIKKLILCLTENAYETVTVNNKTDARKNLLSFQPHILLVDRQIPTMNSLDLCREFHNACNIPILMLSNDDNIVDKVLSLEIGCDDFMTKDFHVSLLLVSVQLSAVPIQTCQTFLHCLAHHRQLTAILQPNVLHSLALLSI